MIEWLCRDHWVAVPKHLRALYGRARRRFRKNPTPARHRIADMVWRQVVKAAIEAAGGIA